MRPLKCLALLIGINEYDNIDYFPKLTNAVRDVESIAQVLRELKFDTEVCIDEDCDTTNLYWGNFLEKIYREKPDVVVFYFAGHGGMINRYDCIIWKDCGDPTKAGGAIALTHAKKVDDVLIELRDRGTQINIVIIDACRKTLGSRGVADMDGIPPKNVPYQTLLAYSTSPGAGAADAPRDDHSPFAGALLKYIKYRDLPVELLFKKVRMEMNPGELRQLSWDYSCLIEDFSFNHGQLDARSYVSYFDEAYKSIDGYCENRSKDLKATDLYRGIVKDLPSILNLCNQAKRVNSSELFVVGRLIMQACENGSKIAPDFITLQNLSLFSDGSRNHLFNGLIYAMYYNNQGEERLQIAASREVVERVNRVYNLLKKDGKVEDFIRPFVELELEDDFYYYPGIEKDHIVDIELVSVEGSKIEGNEVAFIKAVKVDGEEVEYDFLTDHINTYETLKKQIFENLRIPAVNVKIRQNKNVNSDSIVVNFEWENYNEDITSLLLHNMPSDLDELSYRGIDIDEVSNIVLHAVEDNQDQISIFVLADVNIIIDLGEDDYIDDTISGSFIVVGSVQNHNFIPEGISESHFDTGDFLQDSNE